MKKKEERKEEKKKIIKMKGIHFSFNLMLYLKLSINVL